MKLLAAIVLLGAFAGCSSVPVMTDLKPIADERRFFKAAPSPDAAQVTLLRGHSFVGAANEYRILVDGEKVAQLAVGEYVVLDVPSGERLMELRLPFPRLQVAGDAVTFRAEPGGRYFFRINSDNGPRFVRTTQQSAIDGK